MVSMHSRDFGQEYHRCADLFEDTHPTVSPTEMAAILRALGWDVGADESHRHQLEAAWAEVAGDAAELDLATYLDVILRLVQGPEFQAEDDLMRAFCLLAKGADTVPRDRLETLLGHGNQALQPSEISALLKLTTSSGPVTWTAFVDTFVPAPSG